MWSTIPPPGPTCRADFRSSHGDRGSNGRGVDGRVRGGRRWGARARGGCRRDGRRKDGRRWDGRRRDGRRWGDRRRDGRRWDVRERDGRRRERGRSGRGCDDGDDDRRGGRHTLHLDRREGGEAGGGRKGEEEREGGKRRSVRIIGRRAVTLRHMSVLITSVSGVIRVCLIGQPERGHQTLVIMRLRRTMLETVPDSGVLNNNNKTYYL